MSSLFDILESYMSMRHHVFGDPNPEWYRQHYFAPNDRPANDDAAPAPSDKIQEGK